MAKGDWWFKLEWNDWLSDEKLNLCSFEAQGFWMRCICIMHRSDQFELTGTLDQLRRLLGCLPEEITRCAGELKSTGAADVRFGNGEVSIKSRRLERDFNHKEQNRLYQAKHREKAECQVDVRRQSKSKSKKKEIREEKIAETAMSTPTKKKPLLPKTEHKRGMEILQKVIGKYPDGGGQGKALKWMLDNGATLDQIERELKAQHTDYTAKGIRASYLSLQKTIFQAKAESPPGDIMARDYPGADHVPFDVVMPLTFCATRERYIEIRDEWLSRNERYKDEVADYERSRDFRERFSEAEPGDFGTSSPSGRGNGNGSQETSMPIS